MHRMNLDELWAHGGMDLENPEIEKENVALSWQVKEQDTPM